VILDGTYAHYGRNRQNGTTLPGFMVGDDTSLPRRGFGINESELNLSANVDHAIYGSLTAASHPREFSPTYVVVWLGDDGGEVDGDSAVDGGGPGAEGRYIIRARAAAFGAGRAYRAIEAELARICTPAGASETCLPGTRVQSWRLVAAVP